MYIHIWVYVNNMDPLTISNGDYNVPYYNAL